MKTYKVEVYDNGTKHWYLNDKLHCEDGPAAERADGTKFWYLNGQLHREDKPAVEFANGTKHWYLNGKRHREDGPAVELANGNKYWHIHGVELTRKEFIENMNTDPTELTVAEVEKLLNLKNLKIIK